MSANGKAIAGMVLIFLLGCVAGVLGSSAFFMHRTAVLLERGGPAYMDALQRRFARGISLDDQQRDGIHQILMDNLEERKRLQGQIQPQVRQLNQATLQKVRAVLHPDQVERLNRNLEEMRRKFGRARFNWGENSTGEAEPASSGSTPPASH